MTVQTTVKRYDAYGNGVTTVFPIPFYFLDNTHLTVLSTAPGADAVTLSLGSDYSVSGAGDTAGGYLTLTTALASGVKLSILRNVPLTQLTHYVPNDPFPAASHERALDQLTMEVQQVQEQVDRSLTLPPSSSGVSTELPVPASNNIIAWNETATGLQNLDPAGLATVVAFGTANADVFTGDGTTKIFTLSADPGAQANLDVAVGGVTQIPNLDYTWSGGTTVTFASAPPNGVKILIRYFQGLPQGTADAAAIPFKQTGSSITRTVDAKLRDTVSAADLGIAFDDATDNQSSLATALADARGILLPPGVARVGTGNLAPAAKSTVFGSGRESTFLRTTHASNPVISSTAQFVTYRDLSVDRTGAVAGTGIQHWAVNNTAPLEGLLIQRVNLNGHGTGVSIRDLVLGGLEDCYVQAGLTGVDVSNTGANAVASFWMRNVWIRGNTTVGATITNSKSTRLEHVAFESAGGRTCPKGLSLTGGGSHYLNQCWFEALQFAAEFVTSGDVTLDGGYLDGSALVTRGFYASACKVTFDGPWLVENMSVVFATANDGAQIIVRTPSLASQTFQAINGGSVVFDFDYVKTQTYDPPSLAANGTTTQTVTVTGASVGDSVSVFFSNGTTDPNLLNMTGTVTGPNNVVVLIRNTNASTLDVASGTLTVRVRKQPLTS